MTTDRPDDIADWLNEMKARARDGDERAREQLARAVDVVNSLQQLDDSSIPVGRPAANRIHADGLAGIRNARKLTQTTVAERLGTDQGSVSRIERRDDVLLSTLRDYLAAIGGNHPRIVVEVDGTEITLDLNSLTGAT